MLEDVSIICAKIARAEGRDLYMLRMENAVIIKVHARSLMTLAGALKHEKYIASTIWACFEAKWKNLD
jgi:hypothetical protein